MCFLSVLILTPGVSTTFMPNLQIRKLRLRGKWHVQDHSAQPIVKLRIKPRLQSPSLYYYLVSLQKLHEKVVQYRYLALSCQR